MTISISRYVSINSAVIGATVVGVRQLILNLFTTNPLVPPQTYITFTSAAEVGSYFGLNSEEYFRVNNNYFNFVSKNNTVPSMIQFSRWVNIPVAGSILGYGADITLSDWTNVTNGSIGLTIGGFTFQLPSLDFSTATSLSAPAPIVLNGTTTSSSPTVTAISSTASLAVGMAVTGTGIPGSTTILSIDSATQITLSNNATGSATVALTFTSAPSVVNILQAAINAKTGGGADWTAAVVTYSGNNFQLIGGVVGAEAIAVQAGATGTDISGHSQVAGLGQLGWYPQASTANGVFIPGAIISQGSVAESITQTLTNASNANNNFGTFGFCYTGMGTIVLNGTIAQPSTTVTMTSTAGLAVGMYLSGVGIAVGSQIVSIITNTSIVVSQATTISGTGVALTFVNPSANTGLSLAQYQEAANWNYALVPNNQYKILVPVSAANASTWAAAYPVGLKNIGGVCITLTNYSAPVTMLSEYPEQCDAAIEAATNYNPGAVNSVQNYMFQSFPLLTPLVTTDANANAYDALSVNYIGLTQNAGQQLAFYQRGFLQGNAATDALDSGVYANEQWLKSAITAQIMSLLLAVSYVAANPQGVSQVSAVLQSVIQQALLNGTISVGKVLTPVQIADITAITGNPLAWQQVVNVGYFLFVEIIPIPVITPTQYQAVYTLIYSKNDVIRFVQGNDDLI